MNRNELSKLIIDESKEIEADIISMRRHFHMYPETAYEEVQTAKYVEEKLREYGYTTQRAAKTGVMAIIEGKTPGKTVAIRADYDALNIHEENTDKEYCSTIPGKMHACGHDAHAAMLLGAAKIIKKFEDNLVGKIKLIFQPAEEGGGGGKLYVDEGHFDDVDIVFGIHVWGDEPSGLMGTKRGGFLASADEFLITITGKGGHAAAPHEAIDPTAVSHDIYNALQKVISREIDPFNSAVITIPQMKGSDAHNVIPSITTMHGTFRTLDNETRDYILTRIKEIVEGYAKAWRCTSKVETLNISYPPLVNNDEAVDNMVELLKPLDEVKFIEPSMGGEDFAFYTQKTKGAFITLGIKNEEKGITAPHHHPKFDVDESVLWKGTAMYSLMALGYNLL